MLRLVNSATRSNWPLPAVVALALVSCGEPRRPQTPTRAAGPRVVTVAEAMKRPLEQVIVVTGSLAAQESSTLSVKVPGRLKLIHVDIGTAVEQGEVMAQVEPRDYELRLQQAVALLAQARAAVGLPLEGEDDQFKADETSVVRQARAVLEEATKNRERVLKLAASGIAPPADVDAVEAAYKVAFNRHDAALEEVRSRQAALAQRRAEFELARQQLHDTAVRAPFSGVVQSRRASLGEYLSGGSPVITLVKDNPLRLRLEVPERDAPAVRLGQRVRLRVAGETNLHTGVLARLAPALDEQVRMLRVEADVPNPGRRLRPGFFVEAQIVTREDDDGLTVPAAALITFAGLEKVVVAENGQAREKTVTTGRRGPGWVEIVEGLRPGERVILDPGGLRTGEPVAAKEPDRPPAESREPDSGR